MSQLSFTTPECAHDRGHRVELGPDSVSMVRQCLECGETIPGDATVSAPSDTEERPVVVQLNPPSAPKPKKQAAERPLNVLQLARERLRGVKRELRALRKLEREKLELERLINAATVCPRSARAPKSSAQ